MFLIRAYPAYNLVGAGANCNRPRVTSITAIVKNDYKYYASFKRISDKGSSEKDDVRRLLMVMQWAYSVYCHEVFLELRLHFGPLMTQATRLECLILR